ncbi:Cytochrome c oxidase subunit CcoP [uncultured Candidatus Thioglobus sp.]|uniref:hypothetical protein n=1 Tax=Bathymodiolus heckerae thiotrophic gill symbiont TaxID=1052212 RepID=UPI0010B44FB3|nr:hypothetical protein [Bathymodiolus heckerae thiotrophic gill symbiont]CAC9587775.1 hypothetical protein [uncultured Gammaproteobacteria bacterium]SHN89134.1 hypothetical protein BHECKSOX_761 [Bathymodiolus heckerae thiotrophic gill symbiont]SMN15445.1 Cytochrome c oxidase subunit CcoP [uncultured Candidatus Thioglobus sp.]
MKKLLIIALSVFALTAQADFLDGPHNWNNGSSDSFKSAIKAAETGYKANLAVDMAWRDTGKMIKEAKKLHAAGKTAAAVALANKAHTQTVNATAQTPLAMSAGPLF